MSRRIYRNTRSQRMYTRYLLATYPARDTANWTLLSSVCYHFNAMIMRRAEQ